MATEKLINFYVQTSHGIKRVTAEKWEIDEDGDLSLIVSTDDPMTDHCVALFKFNQWAFVSEQQP